MESAAFLLVFKHLSTSCHVLKRQLLPFAFFYVFSISVQKQTQMTVIRPSTAEKAAKISGSFLVVDILGLSMTDHPTSATNVEAIQTAGCSAILGLKTLLSTRSCKHSNRSGIE